MYWKLFEKMFEAHAKREAIRRCVETKNAMLAGAWANSNYDAQEEGKEGARRQMLEQIESGFQTAVTEIRTGRRDEKAEIDWTDPFFAAIKAPRISTEDAIFEGMAEEAASRMRMADTRASVMKKEIDQD
jgi:hypothetical protein